MIQRFIKDMVRYLPAQIIPAIVGMFSIPIITRLFLPEDYGKYILVMTTVVMFSTLVGWLSMSIIRFYPEYEKDGNLEQFYTNIIKLSIISIGIIVLIFLTILSFAESYISSYLYFLMRIGILMFILTSIFEVLLHFLRTKRLVSYYSAFKIWESIARIIFAILLIIFFRFGVEALLWGSILSLVIAIPFLWKKGMGKFSISSNMSVPLTLEMMRYSFPLVAGNLAAWILSLSDRYILEYFRGSQEVGIYSASYAVSEKSIMLLVTLFSLASGPILITIWEKEGKKKSQEFVTKVARYYLIICFPAVVGISVLARPFIKILTAQGYYEGYRIIPLVALGAFFLGLQQQFQAGPIFYKKTHFVMYSIMASGLINLVLNFIFIPEYGFIAAAITTLISYVFLLIFLILLSRKMYIWEFPIKSLVKITCASGFMAIAAYLVDNSLILSTWLSLMLSIIVGATVYLLMLFLLGEIRPGEILAVLDLKNQIFTKNKL